MCHLGLCWFEFELRLVHSQMAQYAIIRCGLLLGRSKFASLSVINIRRGYCSVISPRLFEFEFPCYLQSCVGARALVRRISSGCGWAGRGADHRAPPLPQLLSWLGSPTPPLRWEHTGAAAAAAALVARRTHTAAHLGTHAHHGTPLLPPLLPPLLSWLGASTPPLRLGHAHITGRRRCRRCSCGSAHPRRRSPLGARTSRGAAAAAAALVARLTHAAAQLRAHAHRGAPLRPPLLLWLGSPTPPLSCEHTHITGRRCCRRCSCGALGLS